MFGKKHRKNHPGQDKLKLPPLVAAVWSPAGENTSELSFELSKSISMFTGAFLAELPCLAIPKLGFTADVMDRDRNIDNLIMELDKKGEISFRFAQTLNERLAILPANVYGAPDFPVSNRVELATLIQIPAKIINMARNNGFPAVVFECQGQITTPMTYFALQHADFIMLPVQKPAEIALALLNIKRLISAFKYDAAKFRLVTSGRESLENPVVIKDDEGHNTVTVSIWEHDAEQIVKNLAEALAKSQAPASRARCEDNRETGVRGPEKTAEEEYLIRL